jgi:hypothetical protein
LVGLARLVTLVGLVGWLLLGATPPP